MAIIKPLVRVTQKTGQAISGLASFTAPIGTGLQIKGGDGSSDVIELEKASGKGAYILTRAIVSEEDYKAAALRQSHLGNTESNFLLPFKQGQAVSAHEARSAEFEGDTVLDASMDETVSVGDKVTWSAGKLAVPGSGDEAAGEVTSILPPETAGNHRFLITFDL